MWVDKFSGRAVEAELAQESQAAPKQFRFLFGDGSLLTVEAEPNFVFMGRYDTEEEAANAVHGQTALTVFRGLEAFVRSVAGDMAEDMRRS